MNMSGDMGWGKEKGGGWGYEHLFTRVADLESKRNQKELGGDGVLFLALVAFMLIK